LAEPVRRILFAGDSTIPLIGYAEGNLMSGEREAGRILLGLQKKQATNQLTAPAVCWYLMLNTIF
jgi:hypothetical protein